MKGKYLLALVLALPPAFAADWVLLDGSEHQKLSVDRKTIAVVGKYRKAWLDVTFTKDVPLDGFVYRSQRSLMYYVCAERQSATVQATIYSADNRVIKSASVEVKNAKFSEVIPDTFNEVAMDYVCKAVL